MIATLEIDGLTIRMDRASQVAHLIPTFPSGSWGSIQTLPLTDLIAACKAIKVKRGFP